MIDALLAFLAGIATIAAPCTLPVLPILLGGSVGRTGHARPLFITLGFVISFGFVALALTALTRTSGLDPDALRVGAIAMLLLFGGLLIWPKPFERLTTWVTGLLSRSQTGAAPIRAGNLGAFVLGSTLGLVWTPCAGPVLGSILTLIATAKDREHSAALLLIYTLGAAIPMLAIAYGGQAMTARARALGRFAPRLQQGFGVVVVGLSLAMYFQYDALLVAWLSSFYPNGQIGL